MNLETPITKIMNDHQHQPAWQLCCPVPLPSDGERVTLAHGEGGRLTRKLIRDVIVSPFENDLLLPLDDAARLPAVDGPLAMTTDSFVVSPLYFPGGDIGSLAVYGTVNDLAVGGARPLYLTLSLILEEGLPLSVLGDIIGRAASAAADLGIKVVAGDTKVVPRGAADGMFINTTGLGQLMQPAAPGPAALAEGDALLVTGPIGRHGIAVLCAREELALQPPPLSDCGPLVDAAGLLRECVGTRLRSMRDATRGGVAAVMHEWSESCGLTLALDEAEIPVSPDVRGACELLGLDPLHIANEGTMVVAVEAGAVGDAVAALRSLPAASQAARIGTVTARRAAPVTVRRTLGPDQPLDDPLGAPLPRIC